MSADFLVGELPVAVGRLPGVASGFHVEATCKWDVCMFEDIWQGDSPYVTQWCLLAGNPAYGPDFGRIQIGKASKSALRPAFGVTEGRV